MKGIAIAGQTPAEAAWSIGVFVISLGVTAVFCYWMATDPGRLGEVWAWTRSLNIFVQMVIWLIFLPWMVALWSWVAPWALPLRLVLVFGVLGWTEWLLWPWKA